VLEHEALHRVGRLGGEVVADLAVEHGAHLRRGMHPHGDERGRQERVLGVGGLDGDEALAEVVAELHEVRPALGVERAERLEDPRRVAVHVGEEAGGLQAVGLGHEGEGDVGQPRVVRRAQPPVLLLLRRGRDDGDLRPRGEQVRRGVDEHADPAPAEGEDLARDERDAY